MMKIFVVHQSPTEMDADIGGEGLHAYVDDRY
jgi:hypothetical protein